MFDDIIAQLAAGRLPEPALLEKRLAAGLIKKLGVLKQPYNFWPGDHKINPETRHLLWAAMLLEDLDSFLAIEGIILTEGHERLRAQGRPAGPRAGVEQQVLAFLQELLALVTDSSLNEIIRHRAEKILPPDRYGI